MTVALGHNRQFGATSQLASKRQFELRDQVEQGHAFGDAHDGLHVRGAVCKCAVTMGTILRTIEACGHDRLPKGVIAHRLQPFFDIFIGLKALHAFSIANQHAALQIYGANP